MEPGPVPRCPCTAIRRPNTTPPRQSSRVTWSPRCSSPTTAPAGSRALTGLLGQERPVQYAVAADTGSADARTAAFRGPRPDRVLQPRPPYRLRPGRRGGEPQRARAEPRRSSLSQTPQRLGPRHRTWRDRRTDAGAAYGEPVHWLWLLHDDCAPEPDALAEMLRLVENELELGRDDVAVVGPKLRGWYDRRQLLEVGVTIANSGRRWTGLDRRNRTRASTTTSARCCPSPRRMLVRRDVFEELGGFDRYLPLMRDDVDLCWRANAAGHRVLVAPDAVVRHAEAASRERRAVDCVGRTAASPHKVDKAGAVYTLLVNARTAQLPWILLRLVLGTLLRTVAYLVGKVPGQALDEIRGLLGTALRPERIIAGRRRRGRPLVDKDELRPLFPPRGATVRATFEQAASNLVGRSDPRSPRPAGTARAWSPDPGVTTPTSWRSSSSPGSSASAASPDLCSSSSSWSSPSSPAVPCWAVARSPAERCCPRPPTPPSCGRGISTPGIRSVRAAPSPRRPTSPSSPCCRASCSAPPDSRSRCCSSAPCRWPASRRTSPRGRSSSRGCCVRGRPSPTPSCPPPPARSRAAASARRSSRCCCRSSRARPSPPEASPTPRAPAAVGAPPGPTPCC
ncbi:glycosyltransferase family 2 protein [Streptomyces sp. T1317-0309]|nr:glycosyltransferase family 2 protein [Streptomyces sp. T1317-0309]